MKTIMERNQIQGFRVNIQANSGFFDFPAKIRILVHFHFVTHNPFPESGSKKHCQDSGMRTIDSPYKITPIGVIFKKIFWKNYHIIFGPSPLRVVPKNDFQTGLLAKQFQFLVGKILSWVNLLEEGVWKSILQNCNFMQQKLAEALMERRGWNDTYETT